MAAAAPIYSASPGFHLSDKQARILGPAYEKLERKLRHSPTPDDLWKTAQDPASPFHSFFEWEPKKQQVLYLRTQARYLIMALDVVLPDHGDQKVRAIIPVGDGGFMSTSKASRDHPEVISLQVQRAKADARAIVERYTGWVAFAEFSGPPADFVAAARALAYEK